MLLLAPVHLDRKATVAALEGGRSPAPWASHATGLPRRSRSSLVPACG